MAINSETGSEGYKMINSYNLAKSLADKTIETATANGHNLIANNTSELPDTNGTYIKQHAIFGDDFPLGIADNSDDLQYGIYQIEIYTPRSNVRAEWLGLEIAEVYKEAFKRGTELVYNDQMVRMKESTTKPLGYRDNYFATIISFRYSVIN